MENLSLLEKIVGLIALLLPSLVTLWLGREQSRNQRRKDEEQSRLDAQRGQTGGLVDFSVAEKTMTESWKETVLNLRGEIARLRAEYEERDRNRLTELEGVRRQLQDNQASLDRVLEEELTRAKARKKLENKLTDVTNENEHLQAQVVFLQGDNLRLQTELNDTRSEVQLLRVENDQLRETIRVIRNDVNRIDKKVTGQLPPAPAKGQS
jgi:chromosome segregation ATPase